MKNKNDNRSLAGKYIGFLSGIAICLLSVILIMNIGVIARVFTFPFFFIAGIPSYFIYFYLYFNGFYLIIKDKTFRYKHKIHILTWILFFLGITCLFSLIAADAQSVTLTLTNSASENVNSVNFSDFYFNIFNKLNDTGGYLNSENIYMFDMKNSYGGGIFGSFLAGLASQYLGKTFAYIISIIFILIGLGAVLIPVIVKLSKREPVAVKVSKKEEVKETVDPIIEEIFQPVPSELVEDEIVHTKPVIKPIKEENVGETPSPIKEGSLYNDLYNFENTGTFTRPKFHFGVPVVEPVNEVNTIKPAANSPYIAPTINKTIEEEEISEVDILLEEREKEIIREQMTLDFSDESIDTSKATVQPTYQEPIVVTRSEPAPVSTPVVNEEPKKRRLKFIPPTSDLLDVYETSKANDDNIEVAEQRKIVINDAFFNYKIGARCESYIIGPSVTRFNIVCEPNVSIKQVQNKIDDLCIRLGGVGARFETIVAGQTYSGLEVPNAFTTTVSFKEVFELLPDVNKHPLAVGFGKDISGSVIHADFNEFPHMLVAGTTGSGKSVYIHSVIMALIMRNSPDDLKLVLVDPKQVEMNMYYDMPHLLCPIIYEASHAKVALSKLVDEMDYRYSLFKNAAVVSVKEYNRWAEANNKDKIPYIVIVIDEYADCVDVCKEIAQPIVRLAAKARAAGIHMLIATQRPSVNVITGVIKSNLPTHVALMTSNYVDSCTILNEGGAEKLLGKGDMLVQSPLVSRVGCTRLQSPYVTSSEIDRVVKYLKENYPTEYDKDYLDLVDHSKEVAKTSINNGSYSLLPEEEGMDRNEILYRDIKEWAMTLDYCSMSKIQREFSTGFNRAGKIFKRLQDEGIVAPQPDSPSSAKGCKVLVHAKFSDNPEDDNELNED